MTNTNIKIAVVTPYKNEDVEYIQRCIDCISNQSHPAYLHIIVSDGEKFPIAKEELPQHVHIIELPSGTEDTGATPRAIGSIYAISQFTNGISYLDIDNTVSEDHLKNAAEQYQLGAHVVIAERWICDDQTGEPMFVDNIENGMQFADTNTLFLFERAMMPGTQWWQVPRKPGLRIAGVDRYTWKRVTQFTEKFHLKIAKTHDATVFYRSRWKHHYEKAGRTPPSPSKTLIRINGSYVAKWLD
jgi:cellulose synthase/poly-beta-1,6-N-acetylglucosamine synthase-like glycosyltransferase